VGVGPGRVSPGRCPRRIGDALLAEQQERPVGEPEVGGSERAQQLGLIASHVHRPGPSGLGGEPRNRPVARTRRCGARSRPRRRTRTRARRDRSGSGSCSARGTSARTIPCFALVMAVISCGRGDATSRMPSQPPVANKGGVLFTSGRDGNVDIYVLEADGSSPRRLTKDVAVDQSADWSPDGSRIAFMSNRDGDFEIFVMAADSTAVRQLTYNDLPDGFPRWSPDGSQILFTSWRARCTRSRGSTTRKPRALVSCIALTTLARYSTERPKMPARPALRRISVLPSARRPL